MTKTLSTKTLVFEGAGWDGAEVSTKSGVGNCRIRTRIRNIEGRLIYLELGGTQFSGKHIPTYAKGLNYASHIDHVFYDDSKWDSKRNSSGALSHIRNIHFEYNKSSILNFVNKNLNCSFNDIEIINKGLHVHDTEEPLCDCSREGYIPFKQIEINISILDGVKPMQDYSDRRLGQYKINYDFVKDLPVIDKWIKDRTEREQQGFPNYTYYFSIRWDQNGIINSLELSARQGFCTMGFSAEDLENVINFIKLSNAKITLSA